MVFDENQEFLHILDPCAAHQYSDSEARGIVIFCYDLLKSLWRVHRLQIDVVFDMEFFALASANHRLSYRWPQRGWFTTASRAKAPTVGIS
jgi:hypothetical protein